MTKPIVVVGSVNLDLVVQASRFPAAGETIHGDSFETFDGGKGANQAVAAARLGGRVAMIGCLGDDSFSHRLRAGLRQAGVDTRKVEKLPGSSGVALITRARSGDNSIVVVSGANARLSPERIDAHLDLLRGAGIILTQLEIPLPSVLRLAEHAQDAGVPLVLDPAPACALPGELLRRVAWLTPNETEARMLLGLRDGAELTPAEAAERFLDMGVRNVALKLGRQGVLLAGRDCSMRFIPAFPVNVVDTTAAGDSFNGAFAFALLGGDAPGTAARYASAAAAICVSRAGAQPSLPTSLEVRQFLISHGDRGPSAADGDGPMPPAIQPNEEEPLSR